MKAQRGLALFRHGGNSCREIGIDLQLVRPRPDEIRAFDRHQFGHLLDRQLALAARHQFGDAASRPDDDLVAHGLGNAEPLQQRLESFAAGAVFRPHHGFRGEQRALERLGRADVRLGRALAHRDAKPAAREICAALAQHDPARYQFIDRRACHDRDVECRADLNLPLGRRGRTVTERQLVPAGALERRDEFGQDLDDGVRTQHFDVDHGCHDASLQVKRLPVQTYTGILDRQQREHTMPDDAQHEVKMYSDFKSPYAFLAFDPAFALEEKYNIRLKWKPFQLRLKGKGQRSVYSEYKVKYSYMDARRWANMKGGLMIRGPLKIFDTTPALIGGLFAEKQGKIREYGNKVFDLFFKRELAADEADAVASVIAGLGLPEQGYRDYLAGDGPADYERAQEDAVADQVFGVPMFYFNNEQFWGYDRMGLLEHRLTEAGVKREQPLEQAI